MLSTGTWIFVYDPIIISLNIKIGLIVPLTYQSSA